MARPILRTLLWACVALSIIPRAINLNAPLLESHAFRQTQTAFTVKMFLREGVDLLHPQTPVLGPPWQAPFEFPIFQLAAAGVVAATGMPVDLACRVTNLAFFYASAAFLYLLCRRRIGSEFVCGVIVLLYVWMPFTVMWSRTSMIEYAAVMFVLGWLWASSLWLDTGNRWGWPLALVLGIGGGLAKLTTLAAGSPLLAWFAFERLLPGRGDSAAADRPSPTARRKLLVLALAAVLWLIPVGAGFLWNSHADAIKGASPATQFLTADALDAWNFGTLPQRLDPRNWQIIGSRIAGTIAPYLLLIMAAIGLVWRGPGGTQRLFLAAAALCVIVPVATFFNLYVVHDYYLCAVSPFMAAVVGAGVGYLMLRLQGRLILAALVAAVSVLSLSLRYGDLQPMLRLDDRMWIIDLAKRIDAATPPDEWVLVADLYDWDPTLLYYANRKGFMFDPRAGQPPFLTDPHFTTAVFHENSSRFPAHLWQVEPVDHLAPMVIAKVRPIQP